jgi:GNAT superfamily N-acetyltransferase
VKTFSQTIAVLILRKPCCQGGTLADSFVAPSTGGAFVVFARWHDQSPWGRSGRARARQSIPSDEVAAYARRVEIIECRAENVDVLERVDPTGLNRWHARKFERQLTGLSTYLIAWRDGVPVGHGEIRWDGCASPIVRAAVPDCPELNGLVVYREELRGRGIGTALIRGASVRASDRGCRRIGLGVAADNPRAARLYERLGFVPAVDYVDIWSARDDSDVEHRFEDRCSFLVRDLMPPR